MRARPLVLVVVMVGVVVSAWAAPGSAGAEEARSSLRLILNDPTAREAPADACEVALCTSLLELIDGAQTSIDFAIYGMRNQTAILEALVAARERGVRIRGVVDRDADGTNYYTSTERLVEALGGVRSDLEVERRMAVAAERSNYSELEDRCERPAGFDGPLQCLAYDLGERCLITAHASREAIENSGAIMHNKFFIVDGRYLWTGSTNLSDSGTGGYNANLAVVVDARRVARWYTREFEQMYERGAYHDEKESSGEEMRVTLSDGTNVEALFSPQDTPITRRVRGLIQGARERVDVAVFFLTHKEVAADLIAAHVRGVRVRVILDATAATNGYTKHEVLRAAGIEVKVEDWGGKMHMKSAVIDGEVVIAGSMNWTSAGEGGNDENTLIIRSRDVARQYEAYFDHIWGAIPERWLEGRPDPESRDSTTACMDGVDNDFDHQADDEDAGCGDSPPSLPELPPYRLTSRGFDGCEPEWR